MALAVIERLKSADLALDDIADFKKAKTLTDMAAREHESIKIHVRSAEDLPPHNSLSFFHTFATKTEFTFKQPAHRSAMVGNPFCLKQVPAGLSLPHSEEFLLSRITQA